MLFVREGIIIICRNQAGTGGVGSMGECHRLIPGEDDIMEHAESSSDPKISREGSETMYQRIFDFASIAIMFIEEDTTISLCNKAFEKLTGYTRGEVEGRMSWRDLVALPEERDRMLHYHRERRVDPARAPEVYEFQLLNRAGEVRNMALSVTLVPETKKSLAFLQDITERRSAEAALRESEKWYRAIFENTGLPSIIIAPDTTIIKANTEWARLSGYSIEENEGKKSWTEFVDPEDLERMRNYHRNRRVEDASAPRKYEFRFKRRNGEIRLMINSVTVIPGTQYSIASLMDITELREAEGMRRRLEEQLMMVRKLESIGHLAGGVAHDFNNMLAAILGYAEMLQRKLPEADPLGDMVEEIKKAAQRAGDLTRQLLAFARKQTLEIKPLNLNQVINNFEKMVRRTIREDILIQKYLQSDLDLIEGDVGQIEQIILNLAINAQDAMPHGGTLVFQTSNTVLDEAYADSHPGVLPGRYVMLVMSDSGTGMDEATMNRIFEPFFTTKEVGKGTGLGLATVYGIVKQHGGNIWVYSEPGKGSTFRVYFPRASRREDAVSSITSGEAMPTGSETILVVEDQEQVRRVTSLMLRQNGYTVIEAENGLRALEHAASFREPIHLLLTDVVMPGMNGRDLYEELKQMRPGIRVLYVSGYPREIISHEGILDEGVNLLSKPVTAETLTARVREILDGRD